MFKFNFALDDEDEILNSTFEGHPPSQQENNSNRTQNFPEDDVLAEHSLQDLLLTLPPVISYSPLVIPLTHDRTRVNLTLARRDLFDARFQLISLEDRDNTESEAVNFAQNAGELDRTSEGRALEFLDAPSDLVPGVYEGGLKTWECASDLVDCLDGILGSESLGRLRGKKVLE